LGLTCKHGEDTRFVKSIVTVKHWAAYSVDNYDGPDGKNDRYHYDAKVDMYEFFDTYAPGFKAAVDAGTRGVMCSYNRLNGIPACMNPFLRDVLRTNW
jgi:beta-D-xylosidase 4